jgi:hypothetical protein
LRMRSRRISPAAADTRPIGRPPHDPVKRLTLACLPNASLPQYQALNAKGLNVRA